MRTWQPMTSHGLGKRRATRLLEQTSLEPLLWQMDLFDVFFRIAVKDIWNAVSERVLLSSSCKLNAAAWFAGCWIPCFVSSPCCLWCSPACPLRQTCVISLLAFISYACAFSFDHIEFGCLSLYSCFIWFVPLKCWFWIGMFIFIVIWFDLSFLWWLSDCSFFRPLFLCAPK